VSHLLTHDEFVAYSILACVISALKAIESRGMTIKGVAWSAFASLYISGIVAIFLKVALGVETWEGYGLP
jgi:hypothetical protein